jgi:hypothetical protein
MTNDFNVTFAIGSDRFLGIQTSYSTFDITMANGGMMWM